MTATYSARNTVVVDLPIGDVQASTFNPRKYFDKTGLQELADSIRQDGVMQPIVVRSAMKPGDNPQFPKYEIIAGERRWRASKLARRNTIPAVIRDDLDDAAALRLALVENLQRRDLDPIEEAEGYAQLNRVIGLKQGEIATAVNRSQPAVANAMRLLELPEDVRARISKRELTVSHGVALAKWSAFPAVCSWLAKEAVAHTWTSKAVEGWKPTSWNLPRELARPVHVKATGWGMCQQCPFQAYRSIDSYSAGICLNPVHWEELNEANNARNREEQAARRAAAASAAGGEVPHVSTLATYATFSTWDHPACCTDACPCRQAVTSHVGDIIEICTDPDRYHRFQQEARDAKIAAKAASLAVRTEQIVATVDAITEPGAGELAMFVAEVLIRVGAANAKATVARLGGDHLDSKTFSKLSSYSKQIELMDALRAFEPQALLRIGVEAILRCDAERAYGQFGDGEERRLGWYLGPMASDADNDPWDRMNQELAEWKAAGDEDLAVEVENELAVPA